MSAHRHSQAVVTPLSYTTLSVAINDLIAEYTIHQHFENAGDQPIEVVYSIPMPLDAAFLSMRASLGGETVEAAIQPVRTAERQYGEAIAHGHSAAFLSTPQPGLLCIALGNLLPGEVGTLDLRFASNLSIADQRARFSLPLVHRPRYGRWRLEDLEVPTHDFAVEHPMSATIKVCGMLASSAVTSRSHPVRFAQQGDTLALEISRAMLDRDLVLDFDLSSPLPPTCQLIDDGDANLALATFVLPVAQHAPHALDLCLVLDCSGSMSGDAIMQSREATSAIMEALDADDRIQMLRFGSSIVPAFRRPLHATMRVRQAMNSLLSSIKANLGGTEMGSALKRALKDLGSRTGTPEDADRSRVIILVTDGAVQPEDIASAQAAALRARVRIFIVAVGSSAGAEVLEPLAEITGGVMERAVPAEPIDAGVMRQFRRARMKGPAAFNVTWPSDQASPIRMRAAYPGEATTIAARLPHSAQGEVVVHMDASGGSIRIALGERRVNPAMRALAGQQRYRTCDIAERETLALHYGLLTAETAAVLVKQRSEQERNPGLPQIVQVPQMVPAGMISVADQVNYSGVSFSLSQGLGDSSDAYLDIPCFLRRQEEDEPLHPREERKSKPKAVLTGESRAVLKALYGVLLELICDAPEMTVDMETLIRALPQTLQAHARGLLEATGPLNELLHDRHIAVLIVVLGDLLNMPALDDDQEASLTIALSRDTKCDKRQIAKWKTLVASEWQR